MITGPPATNRRRQKQRTREPKPMLHTTWNSGVIYPSENKADNHGLGFVRADTLVFSRLAALAAENDALRSEIEALRGRSE